MNNQELAATYLREALGCLKLAANGDAFQIAAAKYKTEEALRLLEGREDRASVG